MSVGLRDVPPDSALVASDDVPAWTRNLVQCPRAVSVAQGAGFPGSVFGLGCSVPRECPWTKELCSRTVSVD